MTTAIQLLTQLSKLVLKHPDATIYAETDHSQLPEEKNSVHLALVSEASYQLHDGIDLHYVTDITQDYIQSLEDQGYKYVIIIG